MCLESCHECQELCWEVKVKTTLPSYQTRFLLVENEKEPSISLPIQDLPVPADLAVPSVSAGAPFHYEKPWYAVGD
ncbi:MAG: hypothetical protein PHV30_09160 [Candidatus Margulisbacteria bacterium]|nr:hypothetical protein [Candidatus Margulisiibacteriota bacterium]